ncbi:MAG TPA: metallophosphoesterase [Thermoanaerobaculia bacterium]|nr:metallophosphoesterase [Thermoanaerobaculia bacterium]
MTRRRGLTVLLALLVALPAFAQRHRAVSHPQPELLTILQTTDIHDHVNGAAHVGLDVDPVSATSSVGAYSRIATYVGSVRATTAHPVVLVDSGDWTMGTLYDLTLGTNPVALAILSAFDYDAVTLGNHEWDYTPRGLAGILALAQSEYNFHVPIVASNMNLNGNTDLAPFFGSDKAIRPTYVEQLSNGLKIGYIGLMGEQAANDAPASAPVSFTPLSSDYAAIQSMVDDLRNNQGAQVVIALSHSGTSADGNSGEDISLAQHVHGINVIASGHTHTPLSSAHAVANGTWTTRVIDAGAFGTNVARLDLAVNRATGVTTLVAFDNVPMTNASALPDAMTTGLVVLTDQSLNSTLAPLLSTFFTDYSAANVGKGIYHPVGSAAQEMTPNDAYPVLSPNGLGNLAADSVRNAPNAIIANTPAGVSGFDYTPVQMGVVATGVIRGTLPANTPLTFADIYNILPLGISPDTTQPLLVGYPLVSAYVDVNDVKKVAALQLVGQSDLIPSVYYLNLSGIQYTLDPTAQYTYFKYATAAAVLQLTETKATAGSAAAAQTIGAVTTLALDGGSALLAAAGAGNPYALALMNLNDSNPTGLQVLANLQAVGDVAIASLGGLAKVSALVVSKALAAITTISGYAPTDAENTGSTTPLTSGRIRVSVDLYAVLLLGSVQTQFGITITPYQSATGSTVLSSADLPTLLANRIDAQPATAGIQEFKEWQALLANISALGGTIGPDYASTSNFAQFSTFGAAVRNRNASYPAADIGQLATTIGTLQAAP